MLGYCEENYQRRKSTAKEQKHRMCDADGTRLNIRLILIFQFSKDLLMRISNLHPQSSPPESDALPLGHSALWNPLNLSQ
jgi:hypothetical protein